MADVRIDVEKPSAAGAAPTRNGSLSVSDTYLVRNDGQVLMLFEKANAVDCVVTVQTPVSVGGLAVAEQSFTVPASGGDMAAGTFPASIYNDGSGDLRLTLSDIDGLTIAALRV